MDVIKRQYGGEWNEKYLYFFGIALATLLLTVNLMALKFFQVVGMKFGAGMIFFPFLSDRRRYRDRGIWV